MLYAPETWTKTQVDRKRLEAMEMWICRKMGKISLVDKISNEEVLQRVNETKTMLDTVRKRKQAGHEPGKSGILMEFSGPGKLMELGNYVQP